MALSGCRMAFVGAGNMAEALIKGLLKAKAVAANDVVATGPREARLEHVRAEYGVKTTRDNLAAVRDADVVVLAVKPQIFARVLADIAPGIRPDALVVSVAAGVPMRVMEKHLGSHARLCRAMPNTPAVVGAGASAMAFGATCTDVDRARARALFEAVGMVVEVEEYLLDAVTGLSGSGPAYVFLIVEALADAGVRVGLPRYQSQALAAQTVLGSAKLLLESGEHPGVLKDRVTSPGGTAIAGLHTLEEGGLRTTLINAVVAATERSKQLGSGHA